MGRLAALRKSRLLSLAVPLALFAFRSVASATDFYVSPTGRASGNGSLNDPWSLAAALAQPSAVRPGDTIWLRGGTYRGTFSANLNGTATAPIKVRQYPGERAILDGGNSHLEVILDVSGSYTWYWGFEVMSSDPNRISAQSGSAPTDIGRGEGVGTSQTSSTGAGLKFINLVVHDGSQGFGQWKEATDTEVYGCVIYYNGWTGPDRGHGHGVYVQNLTGYKQVTNNIIFSNFSHGIQSFGSASASLNNVDIQSNTIFSNGMPSDYQRNLLVGGGAVAQNPTIKNNVLYYPGTAGQNLNLGYDPFGAGSTNAFVTGNTIVDGDNMFSPLNVNMTMTGNFFYASILYGSIISQYPSNMYSSSKPSSAQVIVRPNRYETGRANVTILNGGSLASVPVDLSSVLSRGVSFEIRNAQNFFGAPLVSGTYNGGLVSVPAGALGAAAPVGFPTPPSTGPLLNAYVVLTTSSAPPSSCDPSYGDLNQDGAVDVTDLVILEQYLAGNLSAGSPPFTAPLAKADLDRSGNVDVNDLVILDNYLAHNITCLPR